MPVLAKSTLRRGSFEEKLTKGNFSEIWNELSCDVRSFWAPENFQRLEHLQAFARAQNHSCAQVALAYLFHQILNLFAVLGCHKTWVLWGVCRHLWKQTERIRNSIVKSQTRKCPCCPHEGTRKHLPPRNCSLKHPKPGPWPAQSTSFFFGFK